MKISYLHQFNRYVLSDRGRIIHLCHTIGDALRLMDVEPEPLPRPIMEDEEEESFADLMELLIDG